MATESPSGRPCGRTQAAGRLQDENGELDQTQRIHRARHLPVRRPTQFASLQRRLDQRGWIDHRCDCCRRNVAEFSAISLDRRLDGGDVRASAPVGPAHFTVKVIRISRTNMAFDGAASIWVVAACDLEMYEPRVRVVTPNRCWRQPCLAESERAQADHGDQSLHVSEGGHWMNCSQATQSQQVSASERAPHITFPQTSPCIPQFARGPRLSGGCRGAQ